MEKLLFFLLFLFLKVGFAQPSTKNSYAPTSVNATQTASISVVTPTTGSGTRTDTRTFRFRLPSATPDCNLPVLMVFHGDGGSGAGMETSTGFSAIADANNFIAVYPDKLAGQSYFSYRIDAPAYLNGQVDEPFMLAIIDFLYKNYGINKNRVYATGHSSGANFVYFLTAKLPNSFAAFAPVAGYPQDYSASNNVWTNAIANAATPKLPILHIHGTADNVDGTQYIYTNLPNPYPIVPTNNNSNPYVWPIFPLSNKSCSNGSGNYTASYFQSGNTTVDKLVMCAGGGSNKEVAMLIVRGMGHAWPNTANTNGVDGSLAIWNFVKDYQLNTSPVITPSISPTAVTIASGANTTLTASGCGTLNYLWNSGQTTTTISVSPTSTTNYTVSCRSLMSNCQIGNTSNTATITVTSGGVPCENSVNITTNAYPNYTSNQVVKTTEYITTTSPPNIIISTTNSNKLTFQAGKSIMLNNGFSVVNGAVFSAQIGACGNANAHQTFYVEGRNLKDPCGNTVILKGVNKMNIWTDQAGASFPEIAQTGANAVRIVWEVNEGGSPTNDATLDNLIALCIAQKMIPIVEVHDATCNWAGLQGLVDYWKRPTILAIINKYKHAMILNIGNEVGDYSVTAAQFQAGYNSAVSQLRSAGITVPLIIDAPNCGNEIDVLLQTGQNIISTDPLHNILFSVHTYWPMNDAPYPNANPNVPPHSGYGTQTFVTTKFEAAVNANLPLLVGELANYGAWNWDYDFCQQYGQVNYHWIASECQRLGIGYLAWEWGPGNTGGGNANCNVMDMTTNSTYASLWGWGLAIATNATYGLITAQKTPYILSGFQSCN